MAAKKGDMTGPVLALIGSLVYLYVVWSWLSAGGSAGAWFAGAGAFWLPILVGVAAATTFGVLVVALCGLAGWMNSDGWKWAMQGAFWGAIALFALGGAGLFWYVVVGFILLQFGIGKSKM